MRSKKGTIVSTSREKTITVEVHRYESHRKYKKRYRISKKFHAHNPEDKKFEIGDEITIYETLPISKTKKWTIIKPINHDTTGN